jgi:hypothetical protein
VRQYLCIWEAVSGVDTDGAAASVFSSFGEELWEEGGVCTFFGWTGMSWSNISSGRYDTLHETCVHISRQKAYRTTA